MMDKPMGSIIIVVAVLDIHAERKAEAAMNPKMIMEGPPPIVLMVKRASRLWRFHFSMVKAIIKPPMNRKIVLLK